MPSVQGEKSAVQRLSTVLSMQAVWEGPLLRLRTIRLGPNHPKPEKDQLDHSDPPFHERLRRNCQL